MDSTGHSRNVIVNETRIFRPENSGNFSPNGRLAHAFRGEDNFQKKDFDLTSRKVISRVPMEHVPPIPPKPYSSSQQSMYNAPMNMYNGGMYTNMMYGSNYGMSPYQRYGGMYNSMYGGMYGGIYGNNPYQMRDPMDPENRFIQMAEESSRPAFQSIESLVMAIGNIASMLDSTFYALTSSFRAILGVAANFGQLRGVFAQFWSTFALIRGITWLYKKLLYLIGLRKEHPSTVYFNEAFTTAKNGAINNQEIANTSAWPILTFLGLIFATPYLIMKLIGQVSTTAIEESRNPKTWVRPYIAEAMFNFNKTGPNELSVYQGQILKLAPKEVQQTHRLLNTGWALATIDDKISGLIPINYVRRFDSINTPNIEINPNEVRSSDKIQIPVESHKPNSNDKNDPNENIEENMQSF